MSKLLIRLVLSVWLIAVVAALAWGHQVDRARTHGSAPVASIQPLGDLGLADDVGLGGRVSQAVTAGQIVQGWVDSHPVVVIPIHHTVVVRTPTVTRVTGPALLEKIKLCESGGDYGAQNRHSSASGAYQVLDSTWVGWKQLVPGAEKYDRAKDAPAEVQDAVARVVFGDGNTGPWQASRGCWG